MMLSCKFTTTKCNYHLGEKRVGALFKKLVHHHYQWLVESFADIHLYAY